MQRAGQRWRIWLLVCLLGSVGGVSVVWSVDAGTDEVVQTQEQAPAWPRTNPLPATAANIQKGREIYYGKGFCVTCHGRDGKGMGHIPGLRGALPRDFTNQTWQWLRTDGDLMRVLYNGSTGTAMASFVPRILSEQEAWQVIHFLRTFGP